MVIPLAIQHAVSLGDETVLMVDIGGGSVEFMIGNSAAIFYSDSKKIGAARMAAAFVEHDPITPREIKQLQKHFVQELSDLSEALQQYDIKTIVGSSGTMENIANMIANQQSITASVTLNELTYSARDYQKFHKNFIKLNRQERLNQKGLDEKRVDIITPGLVLLKLLINKCGIKKIKISESALREGIILDYINKEKENLDLEMRADYPDPRRRSVFGLLRKCDWHEKHSTHVTKMALKLFDTLENQLQLPDEDRELLAICRIPA